LNSDKTRLATAISLVITGFFLWGSLLGGIKTGFNIFYLIEPLVVLPSLIFVAYELALSRALKDNPECPSKDR
jgi:hypothetical protein